MGDTYKVFLNSAQKLLAEGAVNVLGHLKGDHCLFVGVLDGRLFRSSGTCKDYKHCSGIGWGNDRCRQEGRVNGGGEGKEHVY